MSFYAVASGKTCGIFTNWNDCSQSVNGYKGAVYKKFNTKEEAEEFIEEKEKTEKTEKTQITTFSPDYYVYTDGSCANNGKKNASAGIGIFFGVDDVRNVSQKIDGNQTNNAAELTAIIKTYSIIEEDIVKGKKIAIVSDSEYAIKCVTTYGDKCYKKGWSSEIPNCKLVKMAYELYRNKPNIQFIHIRAHTNKTDVHSIGNDHADKLANMANGKW